MSEPKVITKLTSEDKKIYIEIDGVYRLFLYNRDLRKATLIGLIKEGETLPEDVYEWLEAYVKTRGKRRIMHLLGKQDYPLLKLKLKLEKDGYCQEHISDILKAFEDKGFIDDQKLANRKVDSLKGYKSRREIQYKLKQSGLDDQAVKKALADQLDEEVELESAFMLLSKKFALKRFKLEPHVLRDKSLGFLARKGYPIGVCYKAFERFLQEFPPDDR